MPAHNSSLSIPPEPLSERIDKISKESRVKPKTRNRVSEQDGEKLLLVIREKLKDENTKYLYLGSLDYDEQLIVNSLLKNKKLRVCEDKTGSLYIALPTLLDKFFP